MHKGISEPIFGLKAFIIGEPENIDGVTRLRKDNLISTINELKEILKSHDELESAKAAYYLAILYYKCPNTCEYDPADSNRLEQAIDYFILAMIKANYDPEMVTIPAFKVLNNEIIGPGCRLNHDTYKSFEPISCHLLSELEVSQVYVQCIVDLDEIYSTLLDDNIARDIFQNKIESLRPLLMTAKSKYLRAEPYSFSLIDLITLSADNIFDLCGIRIDKQKIRPQKRTPLRKLFEENPVHISGVLHRNISTSFSIVPEGWSEWAIKGVKNIFGYG